MCPKLPVIANQSADWCGNPPVRRTMLRKVSTSAGEFTFLVVIITGFLLTGGLPRQCTHWLAMTAKTYKHQFVIPPLHSHYSRLRSAETGACVHPGGFTRGTDTQVPVILYNLSASAIRRRNRSLEGTFVSPGKNRSQVRRSPCFHPEAMASRISRSTCWGVTPQASATAG